MAREIEWSKTIEYQIDEVLFYLYEEWNEKVADDFQKDLIELAEMLAILPFIGIQEEGNRYSFPIKMYRLHYYFDDEILRLAYLQDMRSNKEMIE